MDSLDRGLAAPKSIRSQLVRWGTISLLTASSLSAFALTSEAEESSNNLPASSRKTSIQTPSSLINRANLRLGSQGRDVSELQATLKLLGFYAGGVDGFYGESTAIAVSQFQTAAGLPADGVVGPATWNQLFPATPASAIATTSRPVTQPSSSSNSTQSLPSPTSAAAFPVPQIASSNSNPSGAIARTATLNNNSTPNQNPEASVPSAPTPGSPSSEASSVELPILKLGMQGSAVTRLQERLQATGFFQGAVDGAFGPETQTAVEAAQRQYQLEVDGIVGPATWSALLR